MFTAWARRFSGNSAGIVEAGLCDGLIGLWRERVSLVSRSKIRSRITIDGDLPPIGSNPCFFRALSSSVSRPVGATWVPRPVGVIPNKVIYCNWLSLSAAVVHAPMTQPLAWDPADSSISWDSPAAGLTWDGIVSLPNKPNTMPNDNRVSATVSAADKALVLAKLTEIKALLPFLLNLTKDERIQLPKLGSASLLFDEQCASYMASAPNLIPPFVDSAEVTKDRNLRLVLADILREVKKLCEQLDDTVLLVGSEIWMADLSFYQTVRQAARRDVPGADTIYDDLKERFPGVAGDPEEEPPAPPPP